MNGLDLNAMSVADLAALVREPTLEQERALRTELGDDGFRRARDLVVGTRGAQAPRGNVVVLHGIMGGELSTVAPDGDLARVWMNVPRIVVGELKRLRLADDGRTPGEGGFPARPTGILKRYYVELLLSLNREWRVEAFWYDWRLDLAAAAADLSARVKQSFGDEPVHLVAHSMGGLVARTFIATHADQWATMGGADGHTGRLVMLGTPNRGSYAIPQVIVGLEAIVRSLAAADIPDDLKTLCGVLNTFPGTLQMLPAPGTAPGVEKLYEAATWGDPPVSQAHLDAARARHEQLAPVVDPERMAYIAGEGVATLSGVDPARVRDKTAYTATRAGDGRVPHDLGLLDGIPTFFVETDHGGLTKHPPVLDALTTLLTTGDCDLPTHPTAQRAAEDPDALREEHDDAREAEVRDVQRLVATRGAARVALEDQYEIADTIVRSVLAPPAPASEAPSRSRGAPPAPPKIEIRLVNAGIEDVHRRRGVTRTDAIAVGHYRDVVPQGAERALSVAISRGAAARDGGLLKAMSLRGTLRGRLGEPFLMPDPRDPQRVIVLAGMGEPGRFGAAELTVLARELSWALARLGRRDLATVLIGTGNGNLSVDDAIDAWITGLRRGLTGEGSGLRSVTFAESDPRKVVAADRRLTAAVKREKDAGRIDIDYRLIGDHRAIKRRARQRAEEAGRAEYEASVNGANGSDVAPTRMVLTCDGDTYRFGAITADAAVPERAVPIDATLVLEANDDLAAEKDLKLQLERGQFLRELLFPNDLEPALSGHAPLVMLLDGKTARVHWEMVGQPEFEAPADPDDEALLCGFLGTSRGFTRQLRTQFAPPPEPPPPPRRVLRALVVADPAADRRLLGRDRGGPPGRRPPRGLRGRAPERDVLRRGQAAPRPGRGDADERPARAHAALVRRPALRRPLHVRGRAPRAIGLGLLERHPDRDERALPRGPRAEVRLLQRVPVRDHGRRLARGVERARAELRDGVLRARRVEPRVHGLAGQRHGGAAVRADALPPPSRPPGRRWRRRAGAERTPRRGPGGAEGDRARGVRAQDLGRLPALRQPALPLL